MSAKIHVSPTEVWKFFANNKDRLAEETVLVAENKDTKNAVYLTEENGLPLFEVYRGDEKLYAKPAASQDESIAVAKKLYVTYLLPVLVNEQGTQFDSPPVDGPKEAPVGEEDDFPEDPRQEIEDTIYERDDEILQATYDYLEVILGARREDIDEFMGQEVSEFVDRVCEMLAFDFNISIYRPMYVVDEETGDETYEEYPYSVM